MIRLRITASQFGVVRLARGFPQSDGRLSQRNSSCLPENISVTADSLVAALPGPFIPNAHHILCPLPLASYRNTAAALATLSESTVGGIGIATASSPQPQHTLRNAVPPPPKNDAAIAREISMGQRRFSTCGCAAIHRMPRSRKVDRQANQIRAFPQWAIQHRSHRTAHGAPKKRAARSFTHKSAWVPKAMQLRTSAPRFSASPVHPLPPADEPRRISTNCSRGIGVGICPTASRP